MYYKKKKIVQTQKKKLNFKIQKRLVKLKNNWVALYGLMQKMIKMVRNEWAIWFYTMAKE